jgi:hypothetical protein
MNLQIKILCEDYKKVNGIWRLEGIDERPANSLVKQFMQLMKVQLSDVSITSLIKDTSNTNRTVAVVADNFNINAGLGIVTFGILVGTGTNAVTISDYVLQTPIAHGNSAGQLYYNAVAFDNADVTVSGSDCYYDCKRFIENNSGGDINIKEIGVVCIGAASSYKFLIDRTLYDKNITNGTGARFIYRFKISV